MDVRDKLRALFGVILFKNYFRIFTLVRFVISYKYALTHELIQLCINDVLPLVVSVNGQCVAAVDFETFENGVFLNFCSFELILMKTYFRMFAYFQLMTFFHRYYLSDLFAIINCGGESLTFAAFCQ